MFSFSNLKYLDERYEEYQKNPDQLEPSWRYFFEGWHQGEKISKLGVEAWIQKQGKPPFSMKQKWAIFEGLARAELFETFLHTKYVGQKRFSLEGAEPLIPMCLLMMEEAPLLGVQHVVLGMAHRGRLNVLANLLGKPYTLIFQEFRGDTPTLVKGTGDVKYHQGFEAIHLTQHGEKIGISLVSNPSHLEAVDPVVEGKTRAKQEQLGNDLGVIPMLIHGDASVAGQGVVYETFQLSKLQGYKTGGTIHIVINNHIGFTTLPEEGRSTPDCTDIALCFGAPVLRVNAQEPEECVYAALLALKIRQKFQIDVFIDLNCYRKYGHNESDEPMFTQPLTYKEIKETKSPYTLYKEKLIANGELDAGQAQKVETEFKEKLRQALEMPPSVITDNVKPSSEQEFKTSVAVDTLCALAQKFCAVPLGFSLHSKIKRLQEERLAMLENGKIDWGMAEHLAYASLLVEGIPIRISGQDSGRGTFSHRHAVWVDQETEKKYIPLSHLTDNQAVFHIYNSPLSEFAVLGFEFGYTLAFPQAVVIWEAQFGDFANGAQVIIDQFIASSEQKWGQQSGIILLLPHGYEGQGPEHSSARLERFLQLSADQNWTVANCTTPAQLFHLLRRQALRTIKKPLILMTPKALLRHPKCVSPLTDFSTGKFEEIFTDPEVKAPRRLIFCSGKVYYDLLSARKTLDVALVRIEQLYPLAREKIAKVIQSYPNASDWCYVQEEHRNMGAWNYMSIQLQGLTPLPIRYIGRQESSSTAVGSHALHEVQLKQLIQEAFA